MPGFEISASVGVGRKAKGGNRPKDCATVRTMLESIPPGRGGTARIAAADQGRLEEAIRTFQRRQGLSDPDGWIARGGWTWGKLLEATNLATPPVATSRGKKFVLTYNETTFHQGAMPWRTQKLNASADVSIGAKGCLLTATASAFAWKGVRIPAASTKAVGEVLNRPTKAPAYALPLDRLTPSTLEAWMCLDGGQGYEHGTRLDLDAGALSRLDPTRKDILFWGQHSIAPGAGFGYLKLPTPEQLRRWLDGGHLLIARLYKNDHHWLWLTGHDGGETFDVWDVGYWEGPHFTKTINAAEIELMNHYGPVTSLR